MYVPCIGQLWPAGDRTLVARRPYIWAGAVVGGHCRGREQGHKADDHFQNQKDVAGSHAGRKKLIFRLDTIALLWYDYIVLKLGSGAS